MKDSFVSLVKILNENSGLILSICAVVTTFFASISLKSWKDNMYGKVTYELAKEILSLAYRIRNEFSYVRSPFMMAGEYPEDLTVKDGAMKGHLKEEHKAKGIQHAYEKRMMKLDENLQALEDCNYAAQVEWGKELNKFNMPIRKCYFHFIYALQDYLEVLSGEFSYDDIDVNPRELKKIIFARGGDEVSQKIDEAISYYEELLLPVIQNRRTRVEISNKLVKKIELFEI